LTSEIEAIQEEFKNAHRARDGMKQSGQNATVLKREIQQLEEEKQQLIAKIGKIQKRVQNVPKADQWLQAGKNLRLEQLKQFELEERLKDQNSQNVATERKYNQVMTALKTAQVKLMLIIRKN
jgi:intraflagellar transport protein 81